MKLGCRKYKLRENYVFLVLIVLVFTVGACAFVKPQWAKSAVENRTLAQFSHFTLKDFVEGSFQDNFENAISDQFPMSQKIRIAYEETLQKLPKYGIEQLICANRYLVLPASDGWTDRAFYNCEDYIVVVPDRQVNSVALDNIKKFNSLNKKSDMYYYFVKSSNGFDFVNGSDSVNYAKILSENLDGNYHFAALDMNSWEKYKEYFYRTDHHWNYVGSYHGFLDIMKMFGVNNPSVPTGTFTSEEFFFGSGSRMTRNYDPLEKFTIYLFDLPEHDTTINGKKKNYNHISEFINHKYNYDRDWNFYAEVYGADYGEIVFDFHQSDKPNLLIVSNSFSNAVNELVAQYFNKTYVVDLRYYSKHTGMVFKYSEYIKKNHIDKTLIITDLAFIVNAAASQGLEL